MLRLKWFLFFILTRVNSSSVKKSYAELNSCDIGELADEIAAYQDVVKKILDYTTSGPFMGRTYDELNIFVDKFGSRLSGSSNLEASIDYIIALAKKENLSNIVTEEIEAPHWVRGIENITMLQPRMKNIALLGLGSSVGTPLEGITAQVIVVSSFDELAKIADEEVEGKIVLFNSIFTNYFETVAYRLNGATKAAQKGAVACLIRSVTPFSIYTPHTGVQSYGVNVTNIPAAAITIEDADLLNRLYNRNETIILNIRMFPTYDIKKSRNTLLDLVGHEQPEKLVIVSGHIDSWDVGQGAMDDGGGLFISWAAPVILQRLNLIPKRTIRSIFWSSEEPGLIGAYAYEDKHRNESQNINFIMESDEGTFKPLGLEVVGNKKARCIVSEILKLFTSINATTLIEDDSPGSDITVIIEKGIPGASLYNANDRYFWYHHTEADTINVESTTALDLCAGFWAAVAYVIADISSDIPR